MLQSCREEVETRVVWPSGEEGETSKHRLQSFFDVSDPPIALQLIGQYVPDDR